MESFLIVALSGFIKNSIGLVTRPYETCRRIAERGGAGELGYVAILSAVYFVFVSWEKLAAAILTYILSVSLFWTAGKLVGAQGKLKGLALLWGYSLLPTLLWFFATGLLYVVLPPPRTGSAAGVLFSILFLVFSATLFFWKATIGYLALRFGLRLDLKKILVVCAICLPILGMYSLGMYKLGIFRIPFI